MSPNSHVVSETGENVTLTYELQGNGSMQQVTWEKIQSRQIDLLTRCNLSQGKGNASRYRRQILSACGPGMRRSTIVLPHVTASDSGLYRCLFQANTGENETFVFRLTVTDGEYVTEASTCENRKSQPPWLVSLVFSRVLLFKIFFNDWT